LDTTTCLESIKRNSEDDFGESNLVVGTELKMVYLMDAQGYKVEKSFELRGTPCFIHTQGVLNEEWRIAVAVREN
jgi:hypothetical protein